MPHIKSFCRVSLDQPSELAWCAITSANFSKPAWGEMQLSNTKLKLASYELGVVVTPALYYRFLRKPHFCATSAEGLSPYGAESGALFLRGDEPDSSDSDASDDDEGSAGRLRLSTDPAVCSDATTGRTHVLCPLPYDPAAPAYRGASTMTAAGARAAAASSGAAAAAVSPYQQMDAAEDSNASSDGEAEKDEPWTWQNPQGSVNRGRDEDTLGLTGRNAADSFPGYFGEEAWSAQALSIDGRNSAISHKSGKHDFEKYARLHAVAVDLTLAADP